MDMHRNTAAARIGRMAQRPHAALAGVAMVLLLILCAMAAAEPRWSQGQPIPQGANEVIGARVGDALLVYGGQSQGGEPMGIFWMYEPSGDKWTQLPSNPVPVHHATAVGIGNKFYLFGGFVLVKEQDFNGWGPMKNAWVFDLGTHTWSALPPMPTARGALCAATVGRKIYVLGGASIPEGSPLKALIPPGPVQQSDVNEIFDLDTQTWSKGKPLPTARNHMDAAAVDGKIYVIGGRVLSSFSGGRSLNVFLNEAYDVATDTWQSKAPMPTPRSGTAKAVVNGRIHILGGEGWIGDLGGVFRSHEVYDPRTNTWSPAPPMLTPRHGFAAAETNGRIYAVSGVNNAGGAGPLSVLNVNEIFGD